MFFRLTSDPRSSRIEEDAYSVYIDSSKVHMELEKKRYNVASWSRRVVWKLSQSFSNI